MTGMPSCLADLAVDPEHLRELVSGLSGATEVVIDGNTVRITERTSAAGRERARAYLRERYVTLGWDVSEQAYGTGTNLIAERAGRDDTFLIVSAHLDAVFRSPGADDDASGVVSGLAVAEALAGCTLDHGVRMIAFDEEEGGLIGSRAYTEMEPSDLELALGMLQLEMTGYDSDQDGEYLIVDCDMPTNIPLIDALLAAVDTLALPLHPNRYCTEASDHSNFWAVGVPAIVVGEYFFGSTASPDPNPCYHESCDTADLLDYAYMADLTTATALTVGTLVGAK
jgi:putative aminopeptidase FrvX